MSGSQSRPPGRNALAKQRDAVIALLEPAVHAEGFYLEDVDLRSVGRRQAASFGNGAKGLAGNKRPFVQKVGRALQPNCQADNKVPCSSEPL